jgi:hypothetical protein
MSAALFPAVPPDLSGARAASGREPGLPSPATGSVR